MKKLGQIFLKFSHRWAREIFFVTQRVITWQALKKFLESANVILNSAFEISKSVNVYEKNVLLFHCKFWKQICLILNGKGDRTWMESIVVNDHYLNIDRGLGQWEYCTLQYTVQVTGEAFSAFKVYGTKR
jgi:hypothetical protein